MRRKPPEVEILDPHDADAVTVAGSWGVGLAADGTFYEQPADDDGNVERVDIPAGYVLMRDDGGTVFPARAADLHTEWEDAD
jgi:hypothetical protein